MMFLRTCQSRFIPGMNAGAFVSKLSKWSFHPPAFAYIWQEAHRQLLEI